MDAFQIVAIASLLLYALFTSMEFSFLSSNLLQVELNGKKHTGLTTRIVQLFLKNQTCYIITLVTGKIAAFVAYCLSFGFLLHSCFVGLATSIPLLVALIATIVAVTLLIVGVFIPKLVCRINPNKAIRIFALPALLFYIIQLPLTYPISRIIRLIFKNKRGSLDATSPFERYDLLHLASKTIGSSQNEKDEHAQELEMFKNALEFSHLRVRDCMIPRTDIRSIDRNSSIEQLKQQFIESGLSRILIYNNQPDSIIGYVHTKELFSRPSKIEDILRAVDFVPENMSVQKLLASFIKDQKAIAVVVDEFGGVTGLLTIEDILEEITGDIDDEHDANILLSRRLGVGHFLFSGRVEIENINKKYKLNIPESEEYESIAGYVLHHYEKLPKPNEEIKLGNFTIKVLKVEANRIELVELKVNSLTNID